jgi:hypothetical protein
MWQHRPLSHGPRLAHGEVDRQQVDHGVSRVELAVKLEGPRMDSEGARDRSRFGCLVNNSDINAKLD